GVTCGDPSGFTVPTKRRLEPSKSFRAFSVNSAISFSFALCESDASQAVLVSCVLRKSMLTIRSMEEAIRAIAEPNRRRILKLVSGGELSAGQIASRFEITRPAVSQHLTVLR